MYTLNEFKQDSKKRQEHVQDATLSSTLRHIGEQCQQLHNFHMEIVEHHNVHHKRLRGSGAFPRVSNIRCHVLCPSVRCYVHLHSNLRESF